LAVHHINRDDAAINDHDPDTLITLCQECHHWHHQQRPDELSVDLAAADQRMRLGHDKQILAVLTEHGPSATGEWGLPDHIATSERGRIPEDTRELLYGSTERLI
jgi:hypothetical protein